MELRLLSEPSADGATLGSLFVDGVFQCWTLEDLVREMPGQPVSVWKVQDETAIPAGRYRVVLTFSNRFRRILPLLVGIEGFSAVRIHPGNWAANTQGCILVGLGRSKAMVTSSAVAFNALFARINDAVKRGEELWITVERSR